MCEFSQNIVYLYSKTCVKGPLSKRQKIGFQDQLALNAGQMEHSAILSTFIKLSFVIKTFVLSGSFTQILLYLYFLAIALVISYGSEEPAHLCSITRAFISALACPGKSVVRG